MSTHNIAFAANRKIGLECLQILLEEELPPCILLLPEENNANYAAEMMKLVPDVPVICGKSIDEKTLSSFKLDYLLSVHYPYLISGSILDLPSIGPLNLHPAFLPYNRGWHTPTWAIFEQTPYGATLHWIDEGTDTGDIALQKEIEVLPTDTAHELYQRALAAEVDIFKEAIPLIKKNSLPRTPQKGEGTFHTKKDLEEIRRIDFVRSGEETLRQIRALTTNDPAEAAYIEDNGEKLPIRLI